MATPEASTIVRIAHAALGDSRAQVASWDQTPLSWLVIAPTTALLARYSGTTKTEGHGLRS